LFIRKRHSFAAPKKFRKEMSLMLKLMLTKPLATTRATVSFSPTVYRRNILTYIPAYANIEEELNEFADRVDNAGAEPYPFWRKVN
jgi:hypothetical protein